MIKKLFLLTLFQLAFILNLTGDETYWDTTLVRPYVHNSEMQRRWAFSFLASHLKHLHGTERILDIGCGDGKITADISKFVPEGEVVGIDPSQPMLDWAQRQYCFGEYPNLSFQLGGFLQPNRTDKFDLIISNCALQHCLNQKEAFKTLSQLLKTNGKLLISLPAIDNLFWKKARQTIQNQPQWNDYWKDFTPRKFLSIDEYVNLLVEANFSFIKIQKIKTYDPFVDRQEFLDFLLGTLPPVVPVSLAVEFYQAVIDEYLALYPEALKANGTIEAQFNRIEIEAEFVKPTES